MTPPLQSFFGIHSKLLELSCFRQRNKRNNLLAGGNKTPCTCMYPSIILQIHRAVTGMHMTEKHFRQYKTVTMSRPTSQLTYYSVMVATCLPLLPNSWQPIKAITEQFKVTCDVNKKQRCHYPPSRAKLGCQVQLVPAAPQQCPHGD